MEKLDGSIKNKLEKALGGAANLYGIVRLDQLYDLYSLGFLCRYETFCELARTQAARDGSDFTMMDEGNAFQKFGCKSPEGDLSGRSEILYLVSKQIASSSRSSVREIFQNRPDIPDLYKTDPDTLILMANRKEYLQSGQKTLLSQLEKQGMGMEEAMEYLLALDNELQTSLDDPEQFTGSLRKDGKLIPDEDLGQEVQKFCLWRNRQSFGGYSLMDLGRLLENDESPASLEDALPNPEQDYRYEPDQPDLELLSEEDYRNLKAQVWQTPDMAAAMIGCIHQLDLPKTIKHILIEDLFAIEEDDDDFDLESLTWDEG